MKPMKRIREFAEVRSGGTPSRGRPDFFGGSIPWVKTTDLNCKHVTSTEERLTVEGFKAIRSAINPCGTVMIAMYGGEGTIGKSGVLMIESATNQSVASILPNDKVFDSDFLHYQLVFHRKTWMKFSQGNRKAPNINKRIVQEMEVWLPDLSVQKKIANEIRSQMIIAETATKAVRKQQLEVDALANSIIYSSISRQGSKSCVLGDVLQEITQGIGAAWDTYRVLGATKDGVALARSQPGKNPHRYKPVTPLTVFYNPMRILIGSIAFVDNQDEPGITSPDYVVLKGRDSIVDSRWFYFWLRSPLGKKCIHSLARGAVRERMLFNRLAEGEISLPGFNVQRQASRMLKEIEPIKKATNEQMNQLNPLLQKLLEGAFGSN